jgi:hypothetical protein
MIKITLKGNKHGAINYRLTSRGLMYLFSELITPKNIHEIITTCCSQKIANANFLTLGIPRAIFFQFIIDLLLKLINRVTE